MPEYIVELHLVVEADNETAAEAVGERAAAMAGLRGLYPGNASKVTNVYVADVRGDRD